MASTMGAKRSGRAESRWRSLIAAQEQSGKGVAQFAERRGLNAATMYWWRSQVRRADVGEPKFAPIEIVDGPSAFARAPDTQFEIELACGRRLRVWPRFDADELARLIAVLERAC